MKSSDIKRLVLSALLIAIGFVLPYLTGQIQEFGRLLSPLHIPALLAGFICGWPWGLAVGFVLPLMRSLILGMPPLVPVALAMAAEMAVYGAVAGLLYSKLPRRPLSVYLALLAAMLLGRVAGGLASIPLMSLKNIPFGMEAFLSSYFAGTWLGIIVHIALIPPVVFALESAKLIPIKD